MPTRFLLTQDVVDGATAPEAGEVWLADTRLRGFGLRVWRNRSGHIGKAYAIRVKDNSGTFRRRTLSYWELMRHQYWRVSFFPGKAMPSIGAMVEEAREWARDQIDAVQDSPLLATEEAEQRSRARVRISRLTFDNVAQSVLLGMQARGRSQAYIDRLDKLFALHVPETIKQKGILEITTRDIQTVLSGTLLSHENARVLRPLLSNLVDQPSRAGVRGRTSSYRLRDKRSMSSAKNQRRPDLERKREPWFDDVIHRLESEDKHWQQAMCLRLYLDFHAPLSRLMSARWDQIIDHRFKTGSRQDQFYTRRMWVFGEGWRAQQQLSVTMNDVVIALLNRVREEFPDSEYCFPARLGRSVGHIRSVDHVWHCLLHDLAWISQT